GPAGDAGWSTQQVVRTLASKAVMAPDIALNPAGTVAYVVFVGTNHAPTLVRVPLDGSATTTLNLGAPDDGSVLIRAVLPPRVVFADGRVRVLVLDSNIDNPTRLTLGPPTLRLISADAAATSSVLHDFVQGAFPGDD